MGNRNKIESNETIFGRLDAYVSVRGETVANAGIPRWIGTDTHSREFLVRADLVRKLKLTQMLVIAQFDFSERSYFLTAGLDTVNPPSELLLEDLTAGMLTAFLAEVEFRPRVSALEVKATVEYSDIRDPAYLNVGHDFNQLLTLYPTVQVFSAEKLDEKESENVFLLLCLADRRRVDQWIDEGLTNALKKVATLGANRIPFSSLCRAILEMDPSTLFLALYRSLENQYSRKKTENLMSALGMTGDWVKLAETLEKTLSWYPREQEGLETLLTKCSDPTLSQLIACFKHPHPQDTPLVNRAAKLIYDLRNSLVHYRPYHRLPEPDLDWNRLCGQLCNVLCEVV